MEIEFKNKWTLGILKLKGVELLLLFKALVIRFTCFIVIRLEP